MSKMTDLDLVLKSIGKGAKGRKAKLLGDYQLRDEEGNRVFNQVELDGQIYEIPVYGEIKQRPKAYGRIRGKQTSDAQLVARGDLKID